MSDAQSAGELVLRAALRPLAARLVWRRRWRWALIGARWASLASVAIMLAARLAPVERAPLAAFLCPFAGFVCGWLAGAFAPAPMERVVASGDALGLSERLITAWELRRDDSPAALLQRHDALARLAELDLRACIRFQLDARALRLPTAALLVALALGLWPNAMTAVVTARRAERAAIARERAHLAEFRQELAPPGRPLSDLEQRIVAALREAERKLARAASARAAVAALAQAEQGLAELKQPAEPTAASLAQMAAALSESAATRPIADALEARDYESAADSLAQLARVQGGSAAQAASVALARAARTPGLDALTAAALRAAAADLARAAQAAQSQGDASSAAQSALAQAQQSLSEAGQQLAAAGRGALEQAALTGALNALAAARGNISASAAAAGTLPRMAAVSGPGAGSLGTGAGAAGSGNQGGSGQSGSEGSSGGPSQGVGSSGAGTGSTNQAESGGRTPAAGQSTGAGSPGMARGEYERIYDPTRLGGEGSATVLPGQAGQGPSQYVDVRDPSVRAGALLPYEEVLATYRQEALESLAGSAIPPALQSLVKDYFTSLEPPQ